jgi:3-hydroxyisobutyrate dehydrogenase-like beta-hydroxyacid dehydrogenase
MGAGVGKRLVENGVEVLATLEGRGAASRARAMSAGFTLVPEERLPEADIVLSIVPPAAALPFAIHMAELLMRARRKPLFVDCNAVSPATVRRIAGEVAASEAAFVDAGIIGGPPGAGAGPNIYASGPDAPRLRVLARYGLEIRVLDAPVGAASALKMSYAGITKGLIAAGTSMLLAAARAGVDQALVAELKESQQALLASFGRGIPAMFPKAYRWVAEMSEIAAFAEQDPAAVEIFRGASALYERMAQDLAGAPAESDILRGLLRGVAP